MPFSDSELKALKADAKRKVLSAGDSLFVVVESVGKGGGKSFLGITRFPPGGGGKRVEARIGPYGRGAGKWTMKAARGKWESIRTWSRDTGRDPRELRRGQRGADGERGPSKTLQDAIDGALERRLFGSYDKAFRVQKVLAQALDYAILRGWMRRNQNPATKQKREESKYDPKHHPHIEWEQVPELVEVINFNRCSDHAQELLALKSQNC